MGFYFDQRYQKNLTVRTVRKEYHMLNVKATSKNVIPAEAGIQKFLI